MGGGWGEGAVPLGAPPFLAGVSHTEGRAAWSKSAGAPTRPGFESPRFQPDPNLLGGDPALAHPTACGKSFSIET